MLKKELVVLTEKLDHATDDRNSASLELLISEALELAQSNDFDFISQANLFYSIATAYSDLSYIIGELDNEDFHEKQLYYFRKSIDLLNENKWNCEASYIPYIKGLELPLFTNYASALDRVGRRIEAILYYNKALSINSDFSMAIGNLGITYWHYAELMYDPLHRDILHHFAYQYLKKSLENNEGLISEASSIFKKYIEMYDEQYIEFLETQLNIPKLTFDNVEEENYKQWVLNNNVFINPLNDLYLNEMYFASDVLHLPSMIIKLNSTHKLHGLFNQLKQEYVSARYLFYETITQIDRPHFADKDTYLINSGDYPSYSIRIEKNKLAFRSLYSIFDKTAFFINDYYELGIQEKDINFRSIWLSEKRGRYGYRYQNVLSPQDNAALNAIYWISKDIYNKLFESPKPRAKELNDIRNGFEHKYVKIYNEFFPERIDGSVDDLAVYLSESKLFDITLEIMRMVREVLINLSLAVHIEETKRKETEENRGFLPNLQGDVYQDAWKI